MDDKLILAVSWHQKVKEEHIVATADYLSLIFHPSEVEIITKKLYKHDHHIEFHKAKDLLRASGLAPLPESDPEVAEHLTKIREGKALHPVVIVSRKERLYIADGFHRICACYIVNESTEVGGAHIIL